MEEHLPKRIVTLWKKEIDMNKYNNIINALLQLDKLGNIFSIELQSDYEGSTEINVIFTDYDKISTELWDFSFTFEGTGTSLDYFGVDQEIPNSKEILYRKQV